MAHSDLHPEYVDGCWQCKIETVSVSAAATPTVRADTASSLERERRWERDMPAYKRLRRNGLQPPSIDGSRQLETASDQLEVSMGRLFPDKADLRKAQAGVRLANDIKMGLV